jgi:flagellar motor switch protein FliG
VTEVSSDQPAELSGIEKSAVLMMSVGQDVAAEVVKQLSQLEINLLAVAMARIAQVSKQAVPTVFREFVDLMLQETSIGIGAEEYVSGVLERALGAEPAARLVGRLKQGDYSAGIEAINWQEPRALAEKLKAEHPQIVAMIFAYLEPERAQALIQHLPDDLVEQVIPRLAMLDSIPPTAIRELNDSLEHLLVGEASQAAVSLGGVDTAAKILNRIGAERSQRVLTAIGDVDPELAQTLTDNMFVFEDLASVDDRNFQILLRGLDQNLLVVALKGAPPGLLEKVLRNLSQRAAEMLREEIEARGPMRHSEVDAAKKEILAAALALEREGKVVLRSAPGDMVG